MSWMALLLGASLSAALPPVDHGSQWVYVGTYSNGGSQGIYLLELDPESGKVTPRGLAAEATDPSFLAIHPSKKFLYAVGEVSAFDSKPSGSISAYGLDRATGKLSFLNKQATVGAGPCHVSISPDGKAALVANYGGGSVASLPVEADGKLAPAATFVQHQGSSADPNRQKEPHAHSINPDAAGKYAVAADLGLDEVLVYRLDSATATMRPNTPPFTKVASGSGPRHFAFHPDGKHAYVINEIKSTVTAFDYDSEKGVLTEIQTISTLPDGYKGTSYTAEVQVHPSGKYVYGSNRGHDSIAVFKVDGSSGRLTPVGHVLSGGKAPRNFGIDPTGRVLLAANQDSNTIVVFKIDESTGVPKPTGQKVDVPKPVCVKFLPKTD